VLFIVEFFPKIRSNILYEYLHYSMAGSASDAVDFELSLSL